jgi:hypothetical protein
VIRHREIEAEQIHERTEHAFGLTPRPTECQPQHQAHFDGDIQYSLSRPRRPVAASIQAALASGVTRTAPTAAASYSAQFTAL